MIAKLVVLAFVVSCVSAACQCNQKKMRQEEVWKNATLVAHIRIEKIIRDNKLGGLGGGNQGGNQQVRQDGGDRKKEQEQQEKQQQGQGQEQGGRKQQNQEQEQGGFGQSGQGQSGQGQSGQGQSGQGQSGQGQSGQGGQGGQSKGDQVQYEVTYIKTFKPKNGKPPRTLRTASSALDCGMPFLAENTEYLIAAKGEGENYELTSCLNFPANDDNAFSLNAPLLWNAVPRELKDKLESGKFEQQEGGKQGGQ